MAIGSVDNLVTAVSTAQILDIYKATANAKAAGDYQSLWLTAGTPTAGVAPASTAGVIPTSSTTGAFPLIAPSGSNTLYLTNYEMEGSALGTIILYDRLVHSDGLSGTVATAQTVGTPTLTRWTGGAGVGLWLEWYTATGATGVNVTVSYTNQSGTSGQTSISTAIVASPVAGMMLPIPLATGDTGVQAVASVTLSATTGTAGSFGVTLAKRIAQIHVSTSGTLTTLDYAAMGLPAIASGACIAMKVIPNGASTGQLYGALAVAQG